MDDAATALKQRIGEELGVSAWLTIEQLRIDVFGAATDDLEPLHNDPAWCSGNSPYGRPIAYGFLTMSLLTRFLHEVTVGAVAGSHGRTGFPLNYGFDKVRFSAPVPEGGRIRGRFRLIDIETRDNGDLLRLDCSIEIEGEKKPALSGEWLTLWVDNAPAPK